jgi:hypothetical protein
MSVSYRAKPWLEVGKATDEKGVYFGECLVCDVFKCFLIRRTLARFIREHRKCGLST